MSRHTPIDKFSLPHEIPSPTDPRWSDPDFAPLEQAADMRRGYVLRSPAGRGWAPPAPLDAAERGMVTLELPADFFADPDPDEPHIARTASGQQVALSPVRMAEFLESLRTLGNVGLACQRAGVARQTAYRMRHRSPGFARAWDTALVAARAHAEAELADRALNGVEEAVYYHGEEVARRRRYDARLLLAHLARLDKAAERLDVAATLPLLEDQIAMLRAGGAAEEVLPSDLPRDALRQAQHERDFVRDPAGSAEREAAARTPEAPAEVYPEQGRRAGTHQGAGAGAGNSLQDTVTPVTPCPATPCPDCGGRCADAAVDPKVRLTEADCRWLGNRLDRMDAARPAGAATAYELDPAGDPEGELEMRQLRAFEAGAPRWWEVTLADEDEPPAPLDTAAPTAE